VAKIFNFSEIFISLDDKIIDVVSNQCMSCVRATGWCDFKSVLAQHTTFPQLSKSEYGSLCDVLLENVSANLSRVDRTFIYDEERVLSVVIGKLEDLVRSIAEKSPPYIGSKSPVDLDEKIESQIFPKCERLLKNDFGITDDQFELKREILNSCRIRIRDLLKCEIARVTEARSRPSVSRKLSEISEEYIVDQFFQIVEAIEGIAQIPNASFIVLKFQQNLIEPFTASIFAFCQTRYNLPPNETDRKIIIKSVPTVLESVKEALKFFDLAPIDFTTYTTRSRDHLREIGIVISEKLYKQKSKRNVRKLRSELLAELESSDSATNFVDLVGQFILFELTGCRFKWLTGDPFTRGQWSEIFPSSNDDQLCDLIAKFNAEENMSTIVQCLKERTQESSP